MESATDKQWKKWGGSDPYYGVLGYATESIADPERHSEFMATGRADFARALADVEALFGPVARGSVLDFGCGVGRIMAAMLADFDRVTGVDVSDAMIAEARKNVQSSPRADFFNAVSEIPSERKFDLVHSFIVIQHIRPVQGIPLIRALIERVKPGGCFALHFTIADYRKARYLNFFRYRLRSLHWLYNAARGRRLGEPIMEMNRYPFWQVLQTIASLTGGLYGLRHIDHDGPVGVILMGRIPGGSAETGSAAG